MVNKNFQQHNNQPTKYTRHDFEIQGAKVTLSFPENCTDDGVMDIVKQILVYAHVNNELESSKVGD